MGNWGSTTTTDQRSREVVVLEIADELLPAMHTMHQVDDGTIFIYNSGQRVSSMSLYVKYQGKKIQVTLSDLGIYGPRAYGNAIYFYADNIKKICKAVFNSPDNIEVTEVRNALQDETILGDGLCSRVRYGNTYVYRFCDDPETDAIHVDVSDAVLKTLKLVCIHRGKAIYVPIKYDFNRASLIKLRENVAVVEIPDHFMTPFARDSSPFIYFTDKCFPCTSPCDIHTLDTTTMKFLQPLQLPSNDNSLNSIESERNVSQQFSSKMANEFEINKFLGVGGFGVVFEAYNVIDHWKFAVKRISINRRQEERALHEVRALARLDHPGIVRYNSTRIERPPEGWQIMNYPFDSVFIYIQMQLCKYSLTWWLAGNVDPSSRPVNRMKSWFKQVASAVGYIHEMNLIHRDLKPGNILFADADTLKLCDLGIATQRKEENGVKTTLSRSKAGTDLYMSPEQQPLFAQYSSKTDIFTLGLILAELCMVMSSEQRLQAEFIALLTQVDPKDRPDSKALLRHQF